MNIKDIQAQIDATLIISTSLDLGTLSLKDNVLASYTIKTLIALKALFPSESCDYDTADLAVRLQDFLKKHWNFINGTMLAYTAIPDADVTRILCATAKYLVANLAQVDRPPLGIVEVLMPTVNTYSADERFPHLAPYEIPTVRARRPAKWVSPVISIGQLLHTHILGHGGKLLIPILPLTMDRDIDGRLRNPYFDTLSCEEDYIRECVYITPEQLSRMYQHSSATRTLEEAEIRLGTLSSSSSDLLSNLNTLIRSLRLYDAHGGLGRQDDAGFGAYPAIMAFYDYYQALSADSKAKIPATVTAEITKLLHHISDVDRRTAAPIESCIGSRREALSAAMEPCLGTLKEIGQDDASKAALIKKAEAEVTQLKEELQKALKASDYTGRDELKLSTKLLAALEVRIAIRNFADINLITGLSPDEISEVCSDERISREIITAIASIENLVLLTIELSGDKLKALLAASVRYLVGGRGLIISGDDLSMWLSPLPAEKIQIIITETISSIQDLIYFVRSMYDGAKIDIVLSALDKITYIFKSGEDLYKLLTLLSAVKRHTVLLKLGDKILEIIKSASDFKYVLASLNEEQQVMVFSKFEDKIPEMIKSVIDLGSILKWLPEAQQAIVLSVLGDKIVDLINSADELQSILQQLNEEQRIIVLSKFESKIPDMIKSASDFKSILQLLNKTQRVIIFSKFESKIRDMITSGEDLISILKYLHETQQSIVLSIIGDIIVDLIHTPYGLASTLEILSDELRSKTFSIFESKIHDMVKSGNDLEAVLRWLPEAQQAVVLSILEDKIAVLVKTVYDSQGIMRPLTEALRVILFSKFEDKILEMIKSPQDLQVILKYLPAAQQAIVLLTLGDKIKEFIDSTMDLQGLLDSLNETNQDMVLSILGNKIHEIIKSTFDFDLVFTKLSESAFAIGFSAMGDKILDIPKSAFDLISIINPNRHSRPVNKVKRDIIFLVFSDRIPGMIKSICDLVNILEVLDESQGTSVLRALGDKIKDLVRSEAEFCVLLNKLSEAHWAAITFPALRDKILVLFKSTDDLATLLRPLHEAKRDIVLLILGDKIQEFIKSIDDFCIIFNLLSEVHWDIGFSAVGNKISDMVKSEVDLIRLISTSNMAQRDRIFSALSDKIPELIKSDIDLFQILSLLNEAQCGIVVSTLGSKLPELITSNRDLANVLERLSEEQYPIILTVFGDKILDLIKSVTDLAEVVRPLNKVKRAALFSALSARIPEIIESEEFASILPLTPEEELARSLAAVAELESKILRMIGTSDHEASFKSQMTEVILRLKDKVPSEIQYTSSYLKHLFENLSEPQRDAGLLFIRDDIGHLVEVCDPMDFISIITHLNVAQATIICEALKDKMSEIFEDHDCVLDFEYIFTQTPRDKHDVVFVYIKNIIRDLDINVDALTCLTPEQKEEIRQARTEKDAAKVVVAPRP
ncbi:MAG: hypothetical protein KBD25_01060 [Rickettsiaceae bacterium]|nr:hypothetical protein [Rickettsiaceae bacterium]